MLKILHQYNLNYQIKSQNLNHTTRDFLALNIVLLKQLKTFEQFIILNDKVKQCLRKTLTLNKVYKV